LTQEFISLYSLSPSNSLFVNTADGTSHAVHSHGTLHTSWFMVPSVSHILDLNLQLLSACWLTDHDCRIILESDSCFVQDQYTGTLLAAGFVIFFFLQLPLDASPPPLMMPQLLSPLFQLAYIYIDIVTL
jgi:hypothetical protein